MTTHHVKTLSDEIAGDRELRREVEREWFSDATIVQIEQTMDALGITRRELAKRLGCTPANVTQLLRRGSNLTLETLMDIALAMEHRFLAPVMAPLTSAPPWETYTAQQVNCSVRLWDRVEEATTVALDVWGCVQTPRAAVVAYEMNEDHARDVYAH